MRDLQADLEYVTNPPSGGLEYWRKRSIAMPNIAKHAIERALKAESLARELAGALEVAFELLEDHQPNWYLMAHFHQINNALGSYKEALGDEAR